VFELIVGFIIGSFSAAPPISVDVFRVACRVGRCYCETEIHVSGNRVIVFGQNVSRAHPASYPLGAGDSFPGGKAAGA